MGLRGGGRRNGSLCSPALFKPHPPPPRPPTHPQAGHCTYPSILRPAGFCLQGWPEPQGMEYRAPPTPPTPPPLPPCGADMVLWQCPTHPATFWPGPVPSGCLVFSSLLLSCTSLNFFLKKRCLFMTKIQIIQKEKLMKSRSPLLLSLLPSFLPSGNQG